MRRGRPQRRAGSRDFRGEPRDRDRPPAGQLEHARTFGATEVVNPAEEADLAARVREIVGKGGVDYAFEVVGLPQTVRQATDITGRGGSTYVVGKMKPGTGAALTADDLLRGNKKLSGVFMGATVAEIDIPLYTRLYRQGRLNLDDLVSETITLDQVNDGYAKLGIGETARSVVVFD
ncbi:MULTISPECIES: zinc-binding dehydrogenase [Amycolatopsis]|uniref:Zinc-binding dehydrogenase n=1 Tax=Amycolatopsis albidoflavus TaxID=102226 RepID=A0ABW5HXJ0_9PSEU